MTQRRDDDGPKGADAAAEIRARLGGLANDLGDAVGAMADLVRTARDKAEAEGGTVTVESPDGSVKASAGFSVRVAGAPLGGASTPSATSGAPADTERTSRGASPDVEPAREPMVDIYDEDEAWVLTAELPGVTADQLSLTTTDEELVLETIGARRFRYAAALPAGVDAARASHALRNGILEVRLPKTGAAGEPA